MEILTLYKSVLEAGGLVVDPDGFVSANGTLMGGNTNTPVMVNGKRLVLPTAYHQSDPNKENKILFHPLSENILRGESEIITKFRSVLAIKLNFSFASIIAGLLDIAASVETHKRLSPDQAEVLSVAKDADETMQGVFTQLCIKCISGENDASFVKFYLKRAGVIGGKKYSRAGIISFPFYEELKKDQETYYGIKLRKKDRATLLALMEYIMPNIDKPEAYNRGSDSEVAPFFDALMKTFMGVASKINDIIELFKDKIEGAEVLITSSDWVDVFDNLACMISEIRKIPMQSGNEGEVKKTEVAQPQAAQQAPALAYQPAPVAQPIYQPQVQQIPPWQQQQQVAQPPTVGKNSDGSIDFQSILRANPAMAYVPAVIPPSMMTPGMYPGGMPQQQMYQQNPNAPRSNWNNNPNMGMGGMGGMPMQMYPNGQPPIGVVPVFGGAMNGGSMV